MKDRELQAREADGDGCPVIAVREAAELSRV
jgi:hypothetical protein